MSFAKVAPNYEWCDNCIRHEEGYVLGTGPDLNLQVDYPYHGYGLSTCIPNVRLVFEWANFFPHCLSNFPKSIKVGYKYGPFSFHKRNQNRNHPRCTPESSTCAQNSTMFQSIAGFNITHVFEMQRLVDVSIVQIVAAVHIDVYSTLVNIIDTNNERWKVEIRDWNRSGNHLTGKSSDWVAWKPKGPWIHGFKEEGKVPETSSNLVSRDLLY